MTELKTKPNNASVKAYLKTVENDQKRADCEELLKVMQEIAGEKPKMWGAAMVGFGSYHYVYPTGNSGDWFITGFAPRKQALTIYIMNGYSKYDALMKKLGKYKTEKSCLYIKRLDDIDRKTLKALITRSVKDMRKLSKTN